MRQVETQAAEGGRAARADAIGYGPSWLDVVDDRVRRLRVPAWAFWVALWLAVLGIGEVSKWSDGSLPFGVVHPFHAVFSAVTVFMLAACSLLDEVARRALAQARPALDITDADYDRWEHMLTVTPARPMIASNVIGLAAFALGLATLGDPVTFEATKFDPTSAIDLAAIGLNALALSGFLYHTLHQLRGVRAVIASHLRVDLFQVVPLRAFSVLTALTAAALLVANYTMLGALVATAPAIAVSPLPLLITATMSLTALAVFAWPLLDLSTRMRAEKQRILLENADELRATVAERRRLMEAGQVEGVAALKDIADLLVMERGLAEKLPTLPWHASIARGLLTTIVLPIALILLQRILDRALG